MGKTFVGIKNKGFWLRDSILELWLRFAALHIENSFDMTSDLCKIRNNWLVVSSGGFTGWVPHHIEEITSTENGKKIIIDTINSFLFVLKKAPEKLDKNTLNLMGFGEWQFDVETFRLIEVSQAILDLINEKITNGPEDTTFMPGCR
ncbi:hypothetical protein [uncultured Tenacibaculum sp.]|uniref:hypothetical protein n=1 Tax=uncultured Tenacibaculum sp. TaxID=174713 RepID=UPI002607950B|nr:hypothetical protein [uncultured Tenacibaculum sp.]